MAPVLLTAAGYALPSCQLMGGRNTSRATSMNARSFGVLAAVRGKSWARRTSNCFVCRFDWKYDSRGADCI
jgi:hypothetical protein